MAGHSVPIDFWVDSHKISDPVARETLLQDLLPVIEPFSGPLKKVSESDIPGGHIVCLFASEKMSLSVKLYKEGLVSAMLEYFVKEECVNVHTIMLDDSRRIESELVSKFGSTRAKVLLALKRAPPINPYFSTSDDRMLEYDVDEVLFEKKTDFQKVQIVQTSSFGNILVLDDLQNLAECDLPYTHGLMNKGAEEYKGKEVLILGGGDGALLWELLKEEPAFVTMIDIDEVVLQSCQKHLRAACGNCLDSYDGKNYKIIVGDAIAYMKDYMKEGRSFDFVFADLTDIPISESPRGQLWDFIRTIMNLGTALIKPKGKYMTHATGFSNEGSLKMFEDQMKSLTRPVTFTKTSAHIPSFMERWCFYQLTPKL